MRKLLFIGAICALTASTALALPTHGDGYYGGRIYYSRFDGYYSGDGGEFTIRSDGPPGLLLSNAAYNSETRGAGGYSESFQSFCLEIREFVSEPMDVWVSTSWANGTDKPQWDTSNDHFPQSHSWKGGLAAGDDLNPQTAYLYYQFATGNLQNYDYSPGSARAADAGQLQRAIWFLEGELISLNGYNQAKSWVQEAVNATGMAYGSYNPTGTATWGDTIGPVRVLQMYWDNGCGCGRLKQDQLYLAIPAPGAILLSSIGVGLVGWLRRRRVL